MDIVTAGLLIALLAASWRGADMRPLDLLRDSSNMAEYAGGFFPPDFHEWRQYLQELGGKMEVQSEPGQGSCVTFLLPLFHSHQPDLSPAPSESP